MYRLPVFLIAICLAVAARSASSPDSLFEGFENPPDSARPWVYWFIMDGNLSREGISADFEAMHAAGIGGVILMEVDVGIPRGPVRFLSQEWCALFRHAVEEAERLGLEITLNAGPGWTGSGGPWVRVEQSMQHLVASELEVTGPTRFEGILPLPEPRAPFFGIKGLPEEMLKAREEFYSDVAVLAVPKSGAARIADIDEKALYFRAPYTSKPGVEPFLPAPASHPTLPASEVTATSAMLDLTDHLGPEGRLAWEVPEGTWTIMRFGRRTTGTNTRPAPLPGLGFESDKFDRAALEAHFDSFVGKLLQAVGPRPKDRTSGWTMLHIDSWEMSSQNWSGRFAEEFERRRGYSPLFYLPVLAGRVVESLEISERFLWDLRLTAQELVIENHALHLKELGKRHGFGLSIEPYDMNPTADLTLGGVADVPMCEFWARGFGFDSAFTCFEAVSAAHTNGRPIVAAESFTSDSPEAWRLYPAAMKNQGDWALCVGVNRIVFHRFAHQPWLDRRPGMTMGPYGVHWDRTQTWWPMVSAYHRYLARCQFMLREGAPVADILYLTPEGAPHVFRPPLSALAGDLGEWRGHRFDGCSPETLIANARVEEDHIAFPGGARYRVLVLPAFETMTPSLLRKIEELLSSGAVVIGSPPLKSPSLAGFPGCDEEVQALARRLWGDTAVPSKVTQRRVGRGRIFWGGALIASETGEEGSYKAAQIHRNLYPSYSATARVLRDIGAPADFESSGPIRFAHRATATSDIYFVANREAETVEATCTFRVSGHGAELWDPLSGSRHPLAPGRTRDGRSFMAIHFEPHQSFFVVIHKGPRAQRAAALDRVPPTGFRRVVSLEGSWEVSFDPSLGGPSAVTFANLEDWSKRPEEGIRHYSGIANYRKTFDLPDAGENGAKRLYLDLGKVHCLARARLNGRDLGVVWCPPWRLGLSGAARAQGNVLEIEVANLWPNRLIGDKRLPSEQQISWTTWNPYKPDSELLPSGLVGPVSILEGEAEKE
ncbi:MAG: hypothetical protein GHCLOJNM_01201 [bacterium]|nr:hypothetical protein [bacterium]